MTRRPSNPLVFLCAVLLAALCQLGRAATPTADLHDFGAAVVNADKQSGLDGFSPSAEIAFDSSGNMYGSTYYGGRFGGSSDSVPGGVLWEITTGGVYKDLHDFGGSYKQTNGTVVPDGASPSTKVAVDSTGSLYGTTETGGINGSGVLYRFTKGGVYEVLHHFGAMAQDLNGKVYQDGADPRGPVVLDKNGNAYGTTYQGGANNESVSNGDGMVYEFTKGGSYYVLHNFGATITNADSSTGPDGANPIGGVVFDKTGNMFGTASAGGPFTNSYGGLGMVWELDISGGYHDLHDFGGPLKNANGVLGKDGAGPTAGVLLDTLGNMYGTTEGGGPNNYTKGGGDGILWKMSKAGVYSDIHDFGGQVTNANGKTGPDGIGPIAPVTMDSKGNLFGTAPYGGPNNDADNPSGCGMVWEFSTKSVYSDAHDFGVPVTYPNSQKGVDAANPVAGVSFDAFDNLFGVTSNGGPNDLALGGDGVVWTIGSELESVVIAPVGITGGNPATGTITLAGPAGVGGEVVSLASNSVDAMVAPSVTVPAGQSTVTFPINTGKVSNNVVTTITATLGTYSRSATLVVGFPTLYSVGVTPSSVVGNSPTLVTGNVRLTGPAPAGGVVVALSVSQTRFAGVPSTLTIPFGATSATFTVTHAQVPATQQILVKAQYRGSTQTCTLTLTP